MAFETGVASSQSDFLDKLTTFAAANGWTLDEFDDVTNFQAAISRSNAFIQWRWDNTTGIAGFQSLGFAGATAPGSQLDDSGNGDTSGTVDTDRRFSAIGNGPFVRHWFFADAATAPYIYYVLEFSAGFYVHGWIGTIDKFGTWTGGEFHGQSIWVSGNPNSANHNVAVDSAHNVVGQCATIHAEGLPGEAGASKWGVFVRAGTSVGTDRGANARVRFMGGSRDGYLSHAMQGMRANPSNGYVPMVPLQCFYLGVTTEKRYLGKLIDVRELNGFFLSPQQEFIPSGSADTWIAFPAYRKATSGTTSGNLFLAYRKVP